MSEKTVNCTVDYENNDEDLNEKNYDSTQEAGEKFINDAMRDSGEQKLCPECNKFICVEDLKWHLKMCHRKTLKVCPFCGNKFSMSNLSRHIKQVHKKIEESCPVCGKFITKANLSKHVRQVHKQSLQELRETGYTTEVACGSHTDKLIDTITPKKGVKRKYEDEESPTLNGTQRRISGRKRKRNQKYDELEYDEDAFDDVEDVREEKDYAIADEEDYDTADGGLRAISRPKLSNHNQYSVTPGYRIVDMTLMRTALKASQRCGHNSITLAETSDASDAQEDLATILAFVCSQCGTQTVFANSAFSDEKPSNYLLNKTMLPLLGEQGYCALSQVVQSKDGAKPLDVQFNSDTLDTELVMSTENNEQSGLVCEPALEDLLIKQEPMDSDEEMNEPAENVVSITPDSEPATVKEEAPNEPFDSEPANMKVFPVPGGMLTPIPPGTKISSSNVTRTTTSEVLCIFGEKFPAGVYRFSSLVDGSQSIFIIRDDGLEASQRKKGGGHHKYQPLINQPYPAWKKKGHQLGGKKCAKPSLSTAISKASKTRKTPLEFFSKEVKDKLMAKDQLTEDEATKQIIDMWIKMPNEQKDVYRKMVLNPPAISTDK